MNLQDYKMKYKMNSKGVLAISQIMILIIGIFAMVFLIGSVDRVSATDPVSTKTNLKQLGDTCNLDSECSSRICDKSSYGTKICLSTRPLETNNFISQSAAEEMIDESDLPPEEKSKLLQFAKDNVGKITANQLQLKVNEKISELRNVIKDPLTDNENKADATKEVIDASKSQFKSWLTQKVGKYSMWSTISIAAIAAAAASFSIAAYVDNNANERNSRNIWTVAAGSAVIGTVGATTYAAFVASMTSIATAGTSATAAGGALAAAATGISATGIGLIAVGIAVVIMGTFMAATFKQNYAELMAYTPQLWQPPKNGDQCLTCNALEFGCSEYQCKSYGQACELINEGEEEQRCVAIENDREPPILKPLEGILKEGFVYEPLPAAVPGVQGVKIVYKERNDGCIPPFEPIFLGVNVSKPAQCKIDTENKRDFSDMISFMQSPLFLEQHKLFIPGSAMPSEDSLSAIGVTKLQEDNDYQFFIKCLDYNGNPSTYNLLMQFCVQDGPDTTAPRIISTNYQNGAYIKSNKTEIPFEVYTNEPADCSWDFEDLDYDSMAYKMEDCSEDISDFLYDTSFTYGCRSTLNGFKDSTTNIYYIRCKDKPWWDETMEGRRVSNSQSYVLNLIGTEALKISSLTVNGKESDSIISDSTSPIKITLNAKTFGGADEGKSICQYKNLEETNSRYKDFKNNGNSNYLIQNTDNQWLEAGEYHLIVRCLDRALNVAEETINFTIEADSTAPFIARAYYKDNKMNLITNEEANCVYMATDCNYLFVDGTKISSSDKLKHTLPWDTKTELFVKCEDIYGNPPETGECSMVIRAYDKSIGTQE